MSRAVRLRSLACAVPGNRVAQKEVREAAARLFTGRLPEAERLLAVFDRAGIATRHFTMPLEWYLEPRDFGARNRLFVARAEELLLAVARAALGRVGLAARAVDTVVCVTSTGIATPTLEARIAERLGLRPDVERVPLFGLGCAGGVLGLARAASFVRAGQATVLLLVVELCSLALRHSDPSRANLVACALFADGAAAAVLTAAGEGPVVAASGESRLHDSLDVMGWRIEADGFGVLFSPAIPDLVRHRLRPAVETFLARHGRRLEEVDRFALHPGGAKVLDALRDALEPGARDLELAAAVLRSYGNVSAVSVLLVLHRLLEARRWRRALALSMGPGFTMAFLLLER